VLHREREVQRPSAVRDAGERRRAFAAHGADKRGEAGGEPVLVSRRLFEVGVETERRRVLERVGEEIHADLAGRVHDAHGSFAHLGDARGAEARGEAVFEIGLGLHVIEQRVGDRGAVGFDRHRVGLAQRQREVEVMDHQVEHDGDVEVARARRARAHRFQQARPFGQLE